MSRACSGCGRTVKSGSRCTRCKRGGVYDGAHRHRRSEVAAVIDSGMLVRCARGGACLWSEVVDGRVVGGRIRRGDVWHLDHTDDRLGYLGASHAKCNSRAGAAVTNGAARV